PPLGAPQDQPGALAACFEIMDGYNATPWLGRVEFVYRDFLQVLNLEQDTPFPAVTHDWLVERALPDYIYTTSDLIELKGNAYKTKRNEINQFRRSYPDHRMEPVGREHWDGIRDLVNRWLQRRMRLRPRNWSAPPSTARWSTTTTCNWTACASSSAGASKASPSASASRRTWPAYWWKKPTSPSRGRRNTCSANSPRPTATAPSSTSVTIWAWKTCAR
ncbi:MAG: DUF2156 domain-containing protein, partial [Gammaproteobacteria bacterium]|nr:DUF2156 domain-containing protein [Gammaproteobacteria bacterium]